MGKVQGRVQGVLTPLRCIYVLAFDEFFASPPVTSFFRGEPPPKKNPGFAPQIFICLKLSSSIASFVWKPVHFEFRSYGGA